MKLVITNLLFKKIPKCIIIDIGKLVKKCMIDF